MESHRESNTYLPIKCGLALSYALSVTIALLVAAVSVAGLLLRSVIYPTDELLRSFVPNDVVNVLIGVPILLGSMALARRGKLIGLLFWPGALFYMLYNYLIYVFAMPLNAAYVLHLVLVTLSVYTLVGLVGSIDGQAVQQRLANTVPERLSGGVLAGLGLLFLLQALGALVSALGSRMLMADAELALHVSDFLIAPALVIGGVLLWRREQSGYVVGLGLLFQVSMLFIGLIVVLLLQPLLTTAPFALVDVVVVTIIGLISFVPLGLFVRGVGTGPKP